MTETEETALKMTGKQRKMRETCIICRDRQTVKVRERDRKREKERDRGGSVGREKDTD